MISDVGLVRPSRRLSPGTRWGLNPHRFEWLITHGLPMVEMRLVLEMADPEFLVKEGWWIEVPYVIREEEF